MRKFGNWSIEAWWEAATVVDSWNFERTPGMKTFAGVRGERIAGGNLAPCSRPCHPHIISSVEDDHARS
jgi:hypothetical protein